MQTQPELYVDVDIYLRPFPQFGKPKIIGYIGLENIKYAKYICDKKVSYDLNLLLDNAKRKPPDLDVKLNDLLKFLLENEARINLNLERDLNDVSFFCYRGLMTCIACTPYENRESWKVMAILYKSKIYLCVRDTEEKKNRKQNMTTKDIQFTSWGYKFEQYVLSDHPDAEPNPNIPVDEMEEFSLVFTTNLNRHKIVYGAEMDGIRCDKTHVEPLPMDCGTQAIINYLTDKEFVELKTNRHIEYKNQDINFRRFKCKKWWLQSFLAGVNTIMCGFRNDDGTVEELKVYSVKDIPKMSKKFWNPDVCFNFLDTFFTYVKRCLIRKVRQSYGDRALNDLHNLPLTCILLEWTPGSPVKVNESFKYEDDPVLPEWFTTKFGTSEVN